MVQYEIHARERNATGLNSQGSSSTFRASNKALNLSEKECTCHGMRKKTHVDDADPQILPPFPEYCSSGCTGRNSRTVGSRGLSEGPTNPRSREIPRCSKNGGRCTGKISPYYRKHTRMMDESIMIWKKPGTHILIFQGKQNSAQGSHKPAQDLERNISEKLPQLTVVPGTAHSL